MDYFGIDPNTGVITLLGDLTMEVYDEYKLEVLAHDMGEKNGIFLGWVGDFRIRSFNIERLKLDFFLHKN